MKFFAWIGLICLGVSASFLNAANATERKTLTFGGRERTYLVDLPSRVDGKTPLPLVLVFHGGSLGSAEQAEHSYGFRELGKKKNFIAVFPEGIDHQWNDGRDGNVASVRAIDDVAFVAALIDRLAANYPIDAKRVYATGISNGGMFSYALAAKLSSRFAAIGPVAGVLPKPLAENFALKPPVAVIAFHGTADTFVPYQGGQVRSKVGGHILSAADTIALFVKADGCNATPQTETLPHHTPDDHTTVHREIYSGGFNETEVVLYTIDGGGHTWPGHSVGALYAMIAGATTETIDATALMWEFFARHPRQ